MSCMKPKSCKRRFFAPVKSARPVEYHVRVPRSGIHRVVRYKAVPPRRDSQTRLFMQVLECLRDTFIKKPN